jgi:hypothetical protein
MKIAAIVGTSVLGLLLGTAPANAQHGNKEGHGGSEKQHGNEHQKEHGRPSQEQHSDRHQANGHQQRTEQRSGDPYRANHNPPEREHARPQGNGTSHMRQVNKPEPGPHYKARDVWQDHRAHNWKSEHRGWHERGGYHGYRIPDDRFRAHFGRGHWFRVHSAPMIVVDGYPRFQYSGFWFSVVDPWPEYWARTWYETDDVYVDYVNDGYYMYNRRHPGVAIAVNVSF